MKFAILGAGALGTILGAHLSRAGHEVAMIVRGERARILQRQGLVLNGLSAIKARPTVIDDPHKLRDANTLIIATKAIDSARALETLRHVQIDNALSVQNGVLKNELLAAVFGYSRVLGAMADFSGELLANGEVKFTRNVCLHIGEEKGGSSPRVDELVAAIDAAGVRCAAASNIRTREWSKYAGWIAQFPLAVLTRQITWKFLMDERSAGVILRIVREAAQLAAAMNIELTDMPPLPVPSIAHASDEKAVQIIREIGQKFLDTSPEHRMSAQQDVLRGSRLEYEETLGYALAKAREFGVPMPTLDTCYRMISVAYP
ncbi:MAG TPA: 2-dehydropantoate 2-reductase [Steroidobacteraceae bacterium]|jgi:2-dehydropantoate 2-reductase|nr:2-dehydropantoate 2-reductase [Steroidobacteraceae bacterium]